MNGIILSMCFGICGEILNNRYNDKINKLKILNTDETIELLRANELLRTSELLKTDDYINHKNNDNEIICFLPEYYKDYRFNHEKGISTVLSIKNKNEFLLDQGKYSHDEYYYKNMYGDKGLYLQLEKYKDTLTLKKMSNNKYDFKYEFNYLKTERNLMYGSSVGVGLYYAFKMLKKLK